MSEPSCFAQGGAVATRDRRNPATGNDKNLATEPAIADNSTHNFAAKPIAALTPRCFSTACGFVAAANPNSRGIQIIIPTAKGNSNNKLAAESATVNNSNNLATTTPAGARPRSSCILATSITASPAAAVSIAAASATTASAATFCAATTARFASNRNARAGASSTLCKAATSSSTLNMNTFGKYGTAHAAPERLVYAGIF